MDKYLGKMLDDRYQVVLIGLTRRQISALPENILGLERTSSLQELACAYSAADLYAYAKAGTPIWLIDPKPVALRDKRIQQIRDVATSGMESFKKILKSR